ncbi:RNA helicase [Microbotryomycetes sp. JL201]|nr:RNA helicase [Microbotryomycetes sp. JL201]
MQRLATRTSQGAHRAAQARKYHGSTTACTCLRPTPVVQRPPPREGPRRAPSASKRSGASTSGRAGKNQWAPKAASSRLSSDGALQRLANHVAKSWTSGDSHVQQCAAEVGIEWTTFRQLAAPFAAYAQPLLREAVRKKATTVPQLGLDGEHIKQGLTVDGAVHLRDATFGAFARWAAQQPMQLRDADDVSTPLNKAMSKLQQLASAADRRYFHENFPDARQRRRKLVLHVGPTNSGKTHSALVALARARTGVYAGPLRLLAHEVFSRLNEGKIGDEGKRVCNLVTGEEQRILDPEAGLASCTIEMFPTARRLDVAVIDEIQMIGDTSRGTAWTTTVLGTNAREVHLCGEASVVGLVEQLAEITGDECIVKHYSRLSPLVVAETSLDGDLSKIRAGDCLVTFSRNNIFAFKKLIEQKTGLRVAVAYGGLPPEVREEQARLFNEGAYDVLVASDAVGMGLNLQVHMKIKRIVFESVHKWDGSKEVRLPTPQIKQIAGRAGRYGVHTSPTAPDDGSAVSTTTNGEVTTLDVSDLEIVREAMLEPTIQITQASLAATLESARTFEALLPPNTPFSRIFALIEATAQTNSQYRCVGHSGWGEISDLIKHVEPLSFGERYLFGTAPVNLRDPGVVTTLISFAEDFAEGRRILMARWSRDVGIDDALAEIESEMTRDSKVDVGSDQTGLSFSSDTLMRLESWHRCLTLYLWLSYRQSAIFCDREAARALRKRIEDAIDFVLVQIKFDKIERNSKRYKVKIARSKDKSSRKPLTSSTVETKSQQHVRAS